MRAMFVAGARPNFMKVQPVLRAIESFGVETDLVHTGQHYDGAMSDVFFRDLGLRPPDHHLGVGSGTHAAQTAAVMRALEPLVERRRPDVAVVVGDVNSTLAAALVAAKAGTVVAHVEAGLRSRDWTMPEEVNRVVTDRVSDLLFAPSRDAADNLRAEGYRDDQIHLVGNVMVDSLLANLERAAARPILDRLGLVAGDYGLVTLHRPATVDDPATFAPVLAALDRIAADLPLIFPVHPRTAVALDRVGRPAAVRLTDPVGYLDFLALEAGARLVLTDSGGVQEETTVLGVPCLTLRDNTERPVTVTEGTNVLVGLDPGRIVAGARRVLAEGQAGDRPELWDGLAGQRIARVVVDTVGSPTVLRPTDLSRLPGDRPGIKVLS